MLPELVPDLDALELVPALDVPELVAAPGWSLPRPRRGVVVVVVVVVVMVNPLVGSRLRDSPGGTRLAPGAGALCNGKRAVR